MSFRELRYFTEAMRTLGYPRAISMDNFRTPNFPVVADILYWLVLRYDPSAKIPDDIDTETQRVTFLTAVGQVVAKKARLVLKTKNLYCADGRAVKELLKLATILLSAVRAAGEGAYMAAGGGGADEDPTSRLYSPTTVGVDFLASIRPADLAASRAMASKITERGARLHELLGREVEGGVRDTRTSALHFLDKLSGSLLGGGGKGGGGGEAATFERALHDAIAAGAEGVAALEREAAELGEDERALGGKLKKRRGELERLQKRLASLHSVRPAFMDEYERLEAELALEYETYVTRYRNLDFLQRELAEAEAREMEAAEGTAKELRALQRRLQDEGAGLERGEEEGSGGGGAAEGKSGEGGSAAFQRGAGAGVGMGMGMGVGGNAAYAPPTRSASTTTPIGPKAVGRMDAPDDDDDDDGTVGSLEEDDDDEEEDDNEFGMTDF